MCITSLLTLPGFELGTKFKLSTIPSHHWWWWWWLSTCIAHYTERLYCATCPGALWKGMSLVLIEKIRCWAMDHGDDQAMFQTIGPATENARRPNLLRRWSGTISWWWVAYRRRIVTTLSTSLRSSICNSTSSTNPSHHRLLTILTGRTPNFTGSRIFRNLV